MSADKPPVQEIAIDAALNLKATAAALADDFRKADRYLKYKVLVLALWALSALGVLGIACPRSQLSNDIGAKLISSADPSQPVYMIRNESAQTWEDVEVVVNHRYRATLTTIGGGTGSVTLSSAVLFDSQGVKAPSRLQAVNIQLKVRKPRADVWLLRNGVMEK